MKSMKILFLNERRTPRSKLFFVIMLCASCGHAMGEDLTSLRIAKLEALANGGDSNASYQIALECADNEKVFLHWLQHSASNGNPAAQGLLADIIVDELHPFNGSPYLKMNDALVLLDSASRSAPDWARRLGRLHLSGYWGRGEPDVAKAHIAFLRWAELGDPICQLELSKLLLDYSQDDKSRVDSHFWACVCARCFKVGSLYSDEALRIRRMIEQGLPKEIVLRNWKNSDVFLLEHRKFPGEGRWSSFGRTRSADEWKAHVYEADNIEIEWRRRTLNP